MKGQTQIQLFNKRGICVHDIKEHNLITNLFKDWWESVLNKQLYFELPKDLMSASQYMTLPTPKRLSSGLLLLSDPQIESATNWIPQGGKIGYAGAAYSGADVKRGTVNASETGAITDGYRWVWDFATDKANGLIKSVALCPEAGGNGEYLSTNIINYASTSYSLSSGVYDEVLTQWTRYTTGGVGYTKKVQSKIAYESVSGTINTNHIFSDYNEISAPYCYKGKVWVIARKTADSKRYLLKTDGSGGIDAAWDLSSKVSTTITSIPMIMVDNKAIIIGSWSSPNMTFYVYDTDTSSFGSDAAYDVNGVSGTKYPSSGFTSAWTWVSPDGTEIAFGITPSSGTDRYCLMLDKNMVRLDDRGIIAGYYYYFLMSPVAPCGASYYSSSTKYPLMSYLCPAMFSINNLADPWVEKTSDYTMKVTYQLTW